MKIREIEADKCGKCPLIDWCGDPYEELRICADRRFAEMKVEGYIKLAQESEYASKEHVAEDVLKRATVLKPCPFCGGDTIEKVEEEEC